MYFGSVKFFKHLILLIVFLLFAIPLTLMIVFAVKYYRVKDYIANESTQNLQDSSEAEPVVLEQSLDDICLYIKDKGYSPNEVILSLEKHSIAVMDEIFKARYSDTSEELGYTKDYPELYTQAPSEYIYKENTIYLTFDDGPSENTMMILGILDKYNIKATFFVTANETDRGKFILQEIVKRGHTVGIHSYTHNLPEIYSSVDAFLEDFNNTYNYIYDTTGVKPNVFRFPGGSINSYNRPIYLDIIAEMSRRGFIYYDWNASGEDASTNSNWTSIYNSVLSSMKTKSRGIILLHDGSDKYSTVTVVEDLILYFQNKGYQFDKITNDVKPITFGYID